MQRAGAVLSGPFDPRHQVSDDVAGRPGPQVWGTVAGAGAGLVWRDPYSGDPFGRGLSGPPGSGASALGAGGDDPGAADAAEREHGAAFPSARRRLFSVYHDA